MNSEELTDRVHRTWPNTAGLATVALLLGLTGLFIDLGRWNPVVIAASLAMAIGSTMARAKSSSR